MSEYQYYEFQAIDRPLTEEEMRELRSCSSRARIRPTSFVNSYHRKDVIFLTELPDVEESRPNSRVNS